MEIDHIFIFSNTGGKEAERLVEFGLTEGSGRIHPGQGTRNRKFNFENFFLEILWVINASEIQNETTAKTKLWERSRFMENGYSPFGLCLVNSKSTDKLFEQSEKYQPNYFPEGMAIDILTNEKDKSLPWTFRLPYRNEKKTHSEPTKHPNGIRKLTRTEFGMPLGHNGKAFENHFQSSANIAFKNGLPNHVTLEFDAFEQQKTVHLEGLSLTINY